MHVVVVVHTFMRTDGIENVSRYLLATGILCFVCWLFRFFVSLFVLFAYWLGCCDVSVRPLHLQSLLSSCNTVMAMRGHSWKSFVDPSLSSRQSSNSSASLLLLCPGSSFSHYVSTFYLPMYSPSLPGSPHEPLKQATCSQTWGLFMAVVLNMLLSFLGIHGLVD